MDFCQKCAKKFPMRSRPCDRFNYSINRYCRFVQSVVNIGDVESAHNLRTYSYTTGHTIFIIRRQVDAISPCWNASTDRRQLLNERVWTGKYSDKNLRYLAAYHLRYYCLLIVESRKATKEKIMAFSLVSATFFYGKS